MSVLDCIETSDERCMQTSDEWWNNLWEQTDKHEATTDQSVELKKTSYYEDDPLVGQTTNDQFWQGIVTSPPSTLPNHFSALFAQRHEVIRRIRPRFQSRFEPYPMRVNRWDLGVDKPLPSRKLPYVRNLPRLAAYYPDLSDRRSSHFT